MSNSVYPQWWERLRAVVGLGLITMLFAVLVTAALGALIGGGALLLEFALTR